MFTTQVIQTRPWNLTPTCAPVRYDLSLIQIWCSQTGYPTRDEPEDVFSNQKWRMIHNHSEMYSLSGPFLVLGTAVSCPWDATLCISNPFLALKAGAVELKQRYRNLLIRAINMSTKHFINDAEQLVLDSLESLTDTNPTLRFDRNNKGTWHSLNQQSQSF